MPHSGTSYDEIHPFKGRRDQSRDLEKYAQNTSAKCWRELDGASQLKPEVISGDLLKDSTQALRSVPRLRRNQPLSAALGARTGLAALWA